MNLLPKWFWIFKKEKISQFLFSKFFPPLPHTAESRLLLNSPSLRFGECSSSLDVCYGENVSTEVKIMEKDKNWEIFFFFKNSEFYWKSIWRPTWTVPLKKVREKLNTFFDPSSRQQFSCLNNRRQVLVRTNTYSIDSTNQKSIEMNLSKCLFF